MLNVLLTGQLTWNIPLLVIFAAITIVYVYLIVRYRLRLKPMQPVLFLIGIWLFYLVTGSPLLAISYLSFSFHMIQMSFLFFIIPPLILLGIPQALYQKFINPPFIQKVNKFNLTPKIALIAFGTLFLLYHLPFMLTFVSQDDLLQKTYITVLFILSFRMWWPIASPNPRERVLKRERKKYLFQSSIYIMPACIVFIVSALLEGVNNPFIGQMMTHLCLPADQTIQVLPPPFNTKYDQMIAGVFMLGLHKVGLMVTCRLERKC
ncbi:MAG TPA: cytochrome c oxidase assembly protein [Pseudogracilibacillus sp.]|nr:cytochrome c oxidase assembly protein [Pseudogracilibacillus sp.]